MNKLLLVVLSAVVGLPIIALIFDLPNYVIGSQTNLPIEVVAAFLTVNGIMVAGVALFAPLAKVGDTSNDVAVARSVMAISGEFVLSVLAFVLSLPGTNETPNGLEVSVGLALRGGLILMFGGLLSLLVLIFGTYATYLTHGGKAPKSLQGESRDRYRGRHGLRNQKSWI